MKELEFHVYSSSLKIGDKFCENLLVLFIYLFIFFSKFKITITPYIYFFLSRKESRQKLCNRIRVVDRELTQHCNILVTILVFN
jgi:hypothetical protein